MKEQLTSSKQLNGISFEKQSKRRFMNENKPFSQYNESRTSLKMCSQGEIENTLILLGRSEPQLGDQVS
jgi:hypothetical protein